MEYEFKATPSFWREFASLPQAPQRAALAALPIFKSDPYDPRLKAHKVHRLSSLYKKRIMAIEIEGDLRAAFYQEGNVITTISIGTHDIY